MTTESLLINGAVFTVVLSSLCLAGTCLLRKHAKPRSFLATTALAAVSLWPFAVWLGSSVEIGIVPAPAESFRSTPTSSVPATTPKPLASEQAVIPTTSRPTSSPQADWPNALLLLWGLGSAIALAPLMREDQLGRRLTRKVMSDPRSRVDESAMRVLETHSLPFKALQTPLVTAPAALPYGGGVVLLPSSAPALDDDALEAAVLHEAAHLGGRHYLLLWIYGLAVAAAWWNPLVHRARSTAEESLEDLCDDRTSTSQASGEHLARCLITFAEASSAPLPKPAFNMFRSRTPVEARIRRLLEAGEKRMKYSRIAAAGAALLSLGSISLAVTLTSSPQSLKDATFGLKKGTVWIYSVTDSSGSPQTTKNEVVGTTTFQGREVAEILSTSPSHTEYQYLANNDDFFNRHYHAYNQNFPGISDFKPQPLLKKDATVGSSWKWSEIPPMQIMGGGRDPEAFDWERFRVNTTAHVESMNTPTTTPAGTFNAIVVRYDAVTRDGNYSYKIWFAPDVGIIRLEHPKAYVRKLELLEFHPPAN